MSSLGDLLLGKIRDGSPNSEQELESKKQPAQNSRSRMTNVCQEKNNSNSFDHTETSSIPLPEQPVEDVVAEDNRSNASSTDDYVRELLDPNDRPKNVWHVVEGPKNDHSDELDGRSDDNRNSRSPPSSHNDCNNSETSNGEAYNNHSPDQRIPTESKRPIEDHRMFDDANKEEPEKLRERSDIDDGEKSKERPPTHRSDNHGRHTDKRLDRDDDREKSRGHRRERKSDRHYAGRDQRSTSDRHGSRRRYNSDDDDEDLGKYRRNRHHRKSRSRSRSPSSRTSSRRRERTKSDSQSPITQRNSRTILVMQLSPQVVTRDLEDLFRKIGLVKEVRLIMDVKAKRHKGIAYIEFEDDATASSAMTLNGQKFMGIPMVIQSALNEKYSSKGDRYNSSSSQYSKPYHTSSHSSSRSTHPSNSYRVYVGSLHVALTEEMIRSVFEPFGPIIKVELMKDRATGVSRGYCFLTYATTEDGQEAVRCLDGFELAGKKLRVSKSADKTDH